MKPLIPENPSASPPPAVEQETPTQLFLCEINHLILHENQTYIFQAAPGCKACADYLVPKPALKEKEPSSETTVSGQTYLNLRSANLARQSAWCSEQVPDLSFRGNELAGETGEVCNVIKKLERARQGWRGSRDTVEHLAEELADVVICADLIGIAAGIDLEAAVASKFNATSEKVGLPHRLTPSVSSGAKSDSAAGSSQTIVEPSDGNALNLQRALDPVVESVRSKLHERSARGLVKYGTTVAGAELSERQWLTHAQEEAMDLTIYLEKCLSSHAPESSSGFGVPESEWATCPCQVCAARRASSPSSPLLETEREEDSAPPAQPQDARTKDTTGQA